MNIISIDPGGTSPNSDWTGIIGATLTNTTIKIKLAIQTHATPPQIYALLKKLPDSLIIIESNKPELYQYLNTKLKCIHCTTTNKSETNRISVMPKLLTTYYLRRLFKEQKIKIPDTMKELTAQIQEMEWNHGNPKRALNRHDDIFMALLICAHVHRIYLHHHQERKT